MQYGLDKQVIKTEIEGINFERLLNNKNVIYSDAGITYPVYDYERNETLRVHHIAITEDSLFNRLIIGTRREGNYTFIYTYLDVGVAQEDEGNLFPFDISTFIRRVESVLDYLEIQYGIKLNREKIKLESMELNATFEINNKFEEYSQLLKYMIYLAPKKYRNKSLILDKAEATGIILKNDSMQKKVYDKTKELRVKYKIIKNKRYMRIEDTLKHQNKITDVFKTHELYKITDETIKDYLIKSINKDLIKPLERFIELSNKKLLKIAKEEYKRNRTKWIKEFIISALTRDIDGVPVLVDKTQILNVIELMTSNRNHYRKAVKRSSYSLKKLDKYIGVIDKLNELKTKIK